MSTANASYMNQALARAATLSKRDGRLRYVQVSARKTHWTTGMRRDETIEAFWTNGSECGCWHPGEATGRFDPVLTAHCVRPAVLDRARA